MGAYIGRRAPRAVEPPAWEIAGLIPVERVVTRSPDIAITVGPVRVHTTGVVLPFTVRFRPSGNPDDSDELHRIFLGRSADDGDALTLGLRFSDGSSQTNVEAQHAVPQPPEHLLYLDLLNGKGQGPLWWLTYWAWPIPPGDMAVVGSWLARGVSAGETVFTAAELQGARDAVQVLA